MPWRELPHVADIRLEICAPDWPSLLAEAALGMGAQMGLVNPAAASEPRPLQIEALDREELIVRWLTAALVWFERDGVVPVRVKVDAADEQHASGVVEVAPAETICAYIKAVTYHELKVEIVGDQWLARIIFDV